MKLLQQFFYLCKNPYLLRFRLLIRLDRIRHRFGLYTKEQKRQKQEFSGEIPLYIPLWHRMFIQKEQLQELFELEKDRKRYRERVRDFQKSLKVEPAAYREQSD